VPHFDVARVGFDFLIDLHRQLPGRRENEHLRGAGSCPYPVGNELFQYGQCKGRRLAGPGLSDAQQVLAGQQLGDRLCLNGGRPMIVLLGERTAKGRADSERIE
jgi:hypothetical protein